VGAKYKPGVVVEQVIDGGNGCLDAAVIRNVSAFFVERDIEINSRQDFLA
jgi:hypothetical protein